jgi:GNAT superfamily N-acetyltransferase
VSTPRIEAIKLAQLEAYAAAPPPGLSPISRVRARAWAHNPHGEGDQVALLVGMLDGRVVGYLGLVPTLARAGERVERVFWLSAFYTDPAHREAGVGSLLLMRALATGANLGASNSSELARRTYQPLRFRALGALSHFVFDAARLNHIGYPLRVLSRRPEAAALSARLSGMNDGLRAVTRELGLAAMTRALPRASRLEVRPVAAIDDALLEEADRARPAARLVRDPALIRWMLERPWLTTDPRDDAPDYYFSDLREHFDFRCSLLVRPGDGAVRGFMILRRMRHRGVASVTLLDHHLVDPGDTAPLLAAVLDEAREYRADQLVVSYDCAAPILGSPVLSRCFREASRPFDLRLGGKSKLAPALDRLHVSLADGDSSFA